jgi:hypothetical protein
MVESGSFENDSGVVCVYGKLAVAPVNKDGELHLSGAAVIREGVKRGANGAAREEDIINEDDMGAIHGERNVAFLQLGIGVEMLEVIPVEGDVEHAEAQLTVIGGEMSEQAFRNLVAAGADTDEGERLCGVGGADLLREFRDARRDFVGG